MSFSVTKTVQSFVQPSEPTPSETLSLSTIDRVPGQRAMMRILSVFKHGQQPANVIRDALSKALALYYPFAGRFVVSDQGEDMVECNGKGVWFIHAIANCTLEDVKYLDRVPLMISEHDLLPEASPEANPLDVPTMMQVTQFRCSGFVVGFAYSHAIADPTGAAQFLTAIGDFARNITPSVKPIWSRDLIPNPPRPPPEASSEPFPSFNLCIYSFDLPMDYISKNKSVYFESTGENCTAADIFAATVWQMRTRAINIDDPNTPVNLCFMANIRHLLTPEFLPQEGGYYGNCYYQMTVSASNNTIVNGKIIDIVNIIRDGKSRLPKEIAMWKNGELKKDPWMCLPNTYETLYVSDITYVCFTEVDHGWGKPIHITHLVNTGFSFVVIVRPRVLTMCVKEEHLSAFQEQVNKLV